MRPGQWIKNLLVFAPLFFSGQMLRQQLWLVELACFAIFCLASSAVYCLNDLIDANADRQHPLKRKRPIASGEISRKEAICLYAIFAALSIISMWIVSHSALPTLIILAYLALNAAYSLVLKRVAIIDVLCVAFGFILRMWAGAAVGRIRLSAWILVMVFLLSLLLALGKRRGDSNRQYSARLLRTMMTVICAATMAGYLIFCLLPGEIEYYRCAWLLVTAIFVGAALARYSHLAIKGTNGADPTKLVIHDKWLRLAIAGWVITFAIIIYAR